MARKKKSGHSSGQSPARTSSETKFQAAYVLHRQGYIAAAQTIYQEILKAEPAHFHSLQYSGVAAYQNGKLAESIDFYVQALAIRQDDAELYSHLGLALNRQEEFDAAVESFEKALALMPDFSSAWLNLGNTQMNMNRLEDSLASFDQAILYDPNAAMAHSNRGNVLKKMKRFDESIASYDRALSINPNYADAWHNLGIVFLENKQPQEAHACFERALSLSPDSAESYYGNAGALTELELYDAALKNYQKALIIKPDLRALFADYFFLKAKLCLWDLFDENVKILENLIRNGVPVSGPFQVLALSASPEIHKLATQSFLREEGLLNWPPIPMTKLPRHEKIRVGYYSSDFRRHAVAHLATDFLAAHDRERFDFYAFSFGPDDESEERKRIKAIFGERFIDVDALSDQEVLELSRQMEIDIALNMNGFTSGGRNAIFLNRVAPVQVNFLGFPGTTALECMDYVICSNELPEMPRPNFTEKIAWLPRSAFPARNSLRISTRPMCRAEFGLPEEGFVFCCFNGNYKIQPAIFDIWMRLLQAVEGSVLWLLQRNPVSLQNLRRNAEARGVSAERIVGAPWLALDEHLAMHRLADLFLDTLPYNASTTANDALWAGLPVLTRPGESGISCNGAIQLIAIGLQELITHSEAEYEALALELARNPARMKVLKEKLAANRLTTQLFDVPGYTRALEAAYRMMYERYQADLPPDDFDVVLESNSA